MSYTKSLLELIKSKKEISGKKIIGISLSEIAAAWNRNIHKNFLYRRTGPIGFGFMFEEKGLESPKSVEMLDGYDFLDTVNMILIKLEKEGVIALIKKNNEKPTSVLNVASLDSLESRILLELKKDPDIYLTELQLSEKGKSSNKKRLNFDYKNYILSNGKEIYRPRKPNIKEFLRILWLKHQIKNREGKIIADGEKMPKISFAIQIDLIKSPGDFKIKEKKKKFRDLIKGLNKIFHIKNFNLRIDSNREGVLLIHTIDSP